MYRSLHASTRCLILLVLLTASLSTAQPVIDVDPDQVEFGEVRVNNYQIETVTVSNGGDEDLVIEDLQIEGEVFAVGRFAEIHFVYERTDENHSILIQDAIWDEELLPMGDEVGVFTPREECAGSARVEEVGEVLGFAAWGGGNDEPGFRDGEEFEFRFWDPVTSEEVFAEAEILNGEGVYHNNAITRVNLSAEGGVHRNPDRIIVPPDVQFDLSLGFRPDEAGEFEGLLEIMSNDPENDVFEVELRGTGFINHPPEWRDFDRFFHVIEGEVIDFIIEAEDEDGDEIILEAVGDLPERATFEDIGDGTGRFTWETDVGDEGYYYIFFFASDGLVEIDVEVVLIIFPVEEPPVFPDVILLEDQEREILFDLDDYNWNREIWQWEYIMQFPPPPREARMRIEDSHFLSAQPIADFWIEEPGLEIQVIARSPCGLWNGRIFYLAVNPVNDPPESFHQLTPEDGARIEFVEDPLRSISFNWEVAEQNQYETDEVHYNFVLFQEDYDFFNARTDNSSIRLLVGDIRDSAGVAPEQTLLSILWLVSAVDDSGAVTGSSNGPFDLMVELLTVPGDLEQPVPTEFEIVSVFPNPFNDRAVLRLGVPYTSPVTLELFNSAGSLVETIAGNSMFTAGWHQLVIEGCGKPDGCYFIRLSHGKHADMKRILLIK